MKKIQLPKSLNNPLTVLGAGVALIAGVTLAFFLVLIATVGESNPSRPSARRS